VLLATIISVDGESNWLEGAQLLAVYVIIALGFLFIQTETGEGALRMLGIG
jgi:Ca2+:H+ antiporter